jgi:ATP-dependent DNA helicase RecG
VKKGVQKRECEKGSVKKGVQKREYIRRSIKLTEKQKELITLIEDEPDISYNKAAEMLSILQSSAQKRFETLVKKGVIKHEGPSKGGYWKVLTDI